MLKARGFIWPMSGELLSTLSMPSASFGFLTASKCTGGPGGWGKLDDVNIITVRRTVWLIPAARSPHQPKSFGSGRSKSDRFPDAGPARRLILSIIQPFVALLRVEQTKQQFSGWAIAAVFDPTIR